MNAPQQFEPEDLLDDALEGVIGSLEIFRDAVSSRTPEPYLGRSDHDLVWVSPFEDFNEQYADGKTGAELFKALGLAPRNEEVIEIFYPILATKSLYKPSAAVAGSNPLFRYTSEDEEFGQTIGGLREMVHRPLAVAKALTDNAGFRRWRL